MTKSNLSFPDFGGYVLLLPVFLFFSNIILLFRIGISVLGIITYEKR